MDLCGPLLTMSLRKSKHFAMFTNNCTRFTWVYFFKKILETLKRYKQFKLLVVKHLCIFPKVKETNYNPR
ncbi:hypothetical protein BDL97_12G102100 [Sphagnum fallax]|nr:hypothetical protein BDL97_12G102100 [Sphagnum fallax]